jgi:threonylcarbamoyladenosine tRNA methylthiotransferase MtaB
MKIFFDVVGCRLNQSEVEALANQFRALGHDIVSDPSLADFAIVNTCAVTVKAAADSRKKLRRAARKGADRVIATGCWATLYPEVAKSLEGVTDVFDNTAKDKLVFALLHLSPDELMSHPIIREPLPGDRARTRAFIRVQTGCNHHCSYCLTRIARGKSQSRTLPEIQADIESAIAGGAKEIVLTGVQLGSWGQDFLKRKKLANLLKHVLEIEGLQRIRLSSIEPWDIEPALLDFWQDSRLCHHLHIPLQSGDDEILRAMRRPSTTQSYRNLVKGIRKHVPGMAITTDVIVGFPGETESAFTNTLAFIREIAFAGGHVFTFSPRPGTEAYTFEERLAGQVAKLRNAQLRESFNVLGHEYRQKKIGTRRMVLWESSQAGEDGTWMLNGLTDNYIRVIAQANADIWNKISLVQLKAHYPGSIALEGEIIETIHQ